MFFLFNNNLDNNNLIKRIAVGELKTNCYILSTTKNNCLIFDPGSDFEKINDYITKNSLNPTHIFLTHGHYDHIGAVAQLKSAYPDVKIAISEADANCLFDNDKNLANLYSNCKHQPVHANIFVRENFVLKIDDIELKCFFTPGHTPGSVCYLVNNALLLTGDTLFKGSVGRTDLPGGNQSELEKSLKKLSLLFNKTKNQTSNQISVFPGHWLSSTLEKEFSSNPYLNI